ncbi:MAG: hypothetical protein GY940_18255 [bacterium]|nr:hypothetical protein [bacterium]
MKRCKRKNGFIIIETLVSLLLVALSVVTVSKMIVSAFQGYKKSKIGFSMLQETQSFKYRLLSASFDALEWSNGSYTQDKDPFKFRWDIMSIDPGLKIARLWLSYKYNGLTTRSFFYKSRHIKNNRKKDIKP